MVPQPADADGAAEVAHEVEEAGGGFQAVGGKGAEGEGDDGGDGELLGKTADGLGQEEFAPAQSWVMGVKNQRPTVKAERPNIRSQRRSMRRAQKV